MMKDIIVELDQDGFVVGVWCPDATYNVNILDRADKNLEIEVASYYHDLEEATKELVNCLETNEDYINQGIDY
jgi:hypothetical protein